MDMLMESKCNATDGIGCAQVLHVGSINTSLFPTMYRSGRLYFPYMHTQDERAVGFLTSVCSD